MKLDFCNMDSNSGQPKSVLGIGIRRKFHRYDLDDFAQSMTPSSQEGVYFTKGTLPKESICDHISKELNETGSLTAASLKPISDFNPSDSSAPFSVDLSGITVEAPKAQFQSPEIVKTQESADPTQKPNLQRRRKSSLLEGSHLDREVLLRAFENFGPAPSDSAATAPTLPKIDPLPNPQLRVRKTSAPPSLNPMNMEPQSNFANFFFRGHANQLAVPREDETLSKSDQSLNQQSMEGDHAAMKQKRTRRVYKGSRFGELNVFCPPSM